MAATDPTASDVARALAARRWRGVSTEERRVATAPGRTAAMAAKARKREELQAAARAQVDAAIAAGAIPARPSPQTIAAVADVVAAVDVPENTVRKRRKVAAT